MRAQCRRSAFTLVELLVVITIISILAGLLLPALGNAMAAARKISCLGNQRQIGMGFTFYQDGFRTYFPFWGGDQSATRSNWSYELKTFYLSDPGVFKCPAAAGAGRTYYQTNGRGDIQNYPDNPFIINAHQYIAYGYNDYYIGSGAKCESAPWQVYSGDAASSINDYRTARAGKIRSPGETVVVADSYNSGAPDHGVHTIVPGPTIPMGGGWTPAIDDRHQKGAVILWADMHVSWFRNAMEIIQDGAGDYLDRD